MSATNRNQNSDNQTSAGEEVPLTAITPTQTGDENNSNQGTKKGAASTTGVGGTKKDANDSSVDQMYNPEIGIASTPLVDVSDDTPVLFA